jgi:glutamine cyclotransferase
MPFPKITTVTMTLITIAASTLGCEQEAKTPIARTPIIYSYRIINTYPHDPNAFTQGLIYHEGVFYESTGLQGNSSLRKVKLETGEVLQIHHLDDRYFGEGITLWQHKIIQLTWQSRKGWSYNYQTFEKIQEFYYPTQGWGITHDGQKLIMSDGSDKLYFLNAETFENMGHIQVRYQNKPVFRLNELEYIEGEIFANVWLTDYIARISPSTGQALGWINLTGLKSKLPRNHSIDVLNGIAYDDNKKRLFVTGKYWPKLFEIQLVKSQR